MKELLNVIGTIFVFGAVYQIVTHAKQANAILNAAGGDATALQTALTGK